MTEPDVTERLDRLERENRRLKRIGGVVLVGLAAIVLMGQAMPGKAAKVVEAEKFVVRDTAGHARIILGSQPYGGYGVHLYGDDGETRAILAEGPVGQGGYLSLSATRTASSARLSVSPGWVSLKMDATQRTKDDARLEGEFQRKATQGATPEERREAGQMITAWPRDGYTAIIDVMSMPTGMQRAEVEIGHEVTPIKRDNAVTLWSTRNGPSLTISDEQGHDRTVLGHAELKDVRTGSVEQRPASSLILFGEDGRVIWKVP
jgi:hypothetical protein